MGTKHIGRDLSRYAAVILGSPTTVELHNGQNDQVFQLVNGSMASVSSNLASREPVIGVTQEPIANGRLGQVQISGVTPAQFRSGEVIIPSFQAPEFATISDLDDMLVASQFGPVRLLHRNVSVGHTPGWTSASQYWWVLLGGAQFVGSIYLEGVFNGSSTVTWDTVFGDRRAMGLYGSTGETGDGSPAGNLLLNRSGGATMSQCAMT